MYDHLNAIYAKTTIIGNEHTMAKLLNPAVIKLYMASKNRRKSINTLPPCSWVYDLIAPVIYFACEFSIAVRPICDIR